MLAERAGVAVLLVYGLKIPVPRDGQPGFRLTVQCDGAVHVEPVGYGPHTDAALADLHMSCIELGLKVDDRFIISRR